MIGGWEVLELLGRGGMARVYRARHPRRPGSYAIKLLSPRSEVELGQQERFAREVEAISRVHDLHVVRLVDAGTTPEGQRYLVTEWIDGHSLGDVIHLEAPLRPARAARILREIASGLGAIHAQGLIHRDLKPQNVLLLDTGGAEIAKIIDFGLVHAEDWERLTLTGEIVGTPLYMAPETIEGSAVDARTDLYALGVILCEMISGESPFAAEAIPEILARHLTRPPPPLPPAQGLEHLARALLAKRKDQRPASAAAVMQAVDALGIAEPSRVEPDGDTRRLDLPRETSEPRTPATRRALSATEDYPLRSGAQPTTAYPVQTWPIDQAGAEDTDETGSLDAPRVLGAQTQILPRGASAEGLATEEGPPAEPPPRQLELAAATTAAGPAAGQVVRDEPTQVAVQAPAEQVPLVEQTRLAPPVVAAAAHDTRVLVAASPPQAPRGPWVLAGLLAAVALGLAYAAFHLSR